MKSAPHLPASRSSCILWASILFAALLWYWMFSPWTAGRSNFWFTMAAAGVCLSAIAIRQGIWRQMSGRTLCQWGQQLLLAVAIAVLLWGLFWVGDRISRLLFGFARPQVESIYALRQGVPDWGIALLLFLLIGPAEELFWRGFVQQRLMQAIGDNGGTLLAVAIYTLIHLWSFNFMLIMSAAVCGIVWGGLYRLRPRWLPALVFSHALWDAWVFVLFPI